jgi:hypothetical protein
MKLEAVSEGHNEYYDHGAKIGTSNSPNKDFSQSDDSVSTANEDDPLGEADPQEVVIDAHYSDITSSIQIISNNPSNTIDPAGDVVSSDAGERDDAAEDEEESNVRQVVNDTADSRRKGAALRRSPRPRAKAWEEGRALLRDEQPSVTFRRLDVPDINEMMREDAMLVRPINVNASARPKQTANSSPSPAGGVSSGVNSLPLDDDGGGGAIEVLSLATNFFKSIEGKKKVPSV